jgi:hypothetical protein
VGSRKVKRNSLNAEEAHAKALTVAEEVEVEWLVEGESEDV